MPKKLCVYTCITGDYDDLHEIEILEKGVDYLCFTNNKKLQSKTWKIIYIDNNGLDNHHLSRKIKMLGHPIISKNYDVSVWMDASVVWQKKITDFVKTYLKNKPFASFRHSSRKSIHEEAVACLKFHKDSKENILETLRFLDSEQFPDNLGLFEMTVFIKRHNDTDVMKTMKLWFDINKKYSKRDQLSFMYAIWKTGLKVNTIRLDIWNNTWFYNIKHKTSQIIDRCHIYYGDSKTSFDFDKYFSYPYKKSSTRYSVSAIVPNDTHKIELTPIDNIGILYSNLQFEPKPTRIELPVSIPYQNGAMSYIEFNFMRIYGNFKKGQKISFSMEARPLSSSELFQIAQQVSFNLSSSRQQVLQADNENRLLRDSLDRTNQQLQAILNSKSWRAIQKVHKLIPKKS